MSKQSDAKAAQGYDPTPSARTCGKCRHLKLERQLPVWMARANERAGKGSVYTAALDGIEKHIRCNLGGFAVKKTAVCDQFASRHQEP